MILEAGNKYDNSYLDILYKITLKCNFKCEYCTQHNNFLIENKSNLVVVSNFINSLLRFKSDTHVTILGGEPTCSDLNYFIRLLDNNIDIEIHTNLSRDIDYYLRLLKNKNNITFTTSWHSRSLKFYSIESFIEKCNIIGNMKIFIMYDPDYSDLCFKIFDKLNKKHGHKVEIHRIYFNDKYKISDYDYTKINILNKNDNGYENDRIPFKFDNGNLKYLDNETIKNLNFNHFENYHCDAGYSCLAIDYDAKVYPCLTYLFNKKDNFDINNFNFTKTICRYKKCLCELDIFKSLV